MLCQHFKHFHFLLQFLVYSCSEKCGPRGVCTSSSSSVFMSPSWTFTCSCQIGFNGSVCYVDPPTSSGSSSGSNTGTVLIAVLIPVGLCILVLVVVLYIRSKRNQEVPGSPPRVVRRDSSVLSVQAISLPKIDSLPNASFSDFRESRGSFYA